MQGILTKIQLIPNNNDSESCGYNYGNLFLKKVAVKITVCLRMTHS